VRVVCANCDTDPRRDATVGAACETCGSALVQIADAENLVGTTIDGRFELVGVLGQGGMGTVYRAVQKSIGREVALKLIDRRFEGDVTAVKRFLREAKLASQLAHPNTVGVIDFGQSAEGRLYLVMELVRGKTLLQLPESGALPLSRIVKIGAQLCDALEAAHALGIVHRDLKLENVILVDGDRELVKVLDFGLARSLVDTDPDSRATAVGLVAGTPRYLSPEVALHAAAPAPAQDIYALGVLLGELAGARKMWEMATLEGLFAQKAVGATNLEGLPSGLRPVIAKLLAVAPASRPDAKAARAMLLSIDIKTSSLAFEATSDLSVAPLNTPLTGAPSVADAQGNFEPELDPIALTTDAFEPPRPKQDALEIETAWGAEKAEKAARYDARKHLKPRRRMGGVLAALAVIAVVVAGVIYVATRPAPPPEQHVVPAPHTVSITVRALGPTKVLMDGQPIGSTPLTIDVPKSKRMIVITVDTAVRQITPDRDQVVDFTR
jgi:Protein kinase domain